MVRLKRRWGSALMVMAVAACALPAPASAILSPNTTVDEFSDPGPGVGCSLREAVEAASTDGVYGGCSSTDVGDEGISIPPGDYVLTRDGVDDTNSAGDLDITNEELGLNAFSGSVTIRGDLDMAGDDRVLDVQSSAPGFALLAVTIRDGRASGVGGGIRTAAPVLDGSRIILSTITGNQATSHGGGLEIAGGDVVRIVNSTFSGNVAGEDGGGFDTNTGATVILRNTTVTNNTADSGAPETFKGGGFVSFGAGTEISLYNSIIAGNFDLTTTAGTFAPDCYEYSAGPMITSEQHNLIGTTTGCEGISAGTGDIRNVDPLLAPLTLNRPGNLRNTMTHALLPDSPARDTGDPATCEAEDQTDVDRPLGPVCDIGAFEADYIPPPTPPPFTGTTPPGNPASPINPAGNVRKRKCKKKRTSAGATAAAKKKCKKKQR